MSVVLLSENDGENGSFIYRHQFPFFPRRKKSTLLKADAIQETLVKNYYEVSILSTEKGPAFLFRVVIKKVPK